eukprot:3622327-Rhodomonas_salina.2
MSTWLLSYIVLRLLRHQDICSCSISRWHAGSTTLPHYIFSLGGHESACVVLTWVTIQDLQRKAEEQVGEVDEEVQCPPALAYSQIGLRDLLPRRKNGDVGRPSVFLGGVASAGRKCSGEPQRILHRAVSRRVAQAITTAAVLASSCSADRWAANSFFAVKRDP